MTKADVLSTCREIKICNHYIYTGPDYDLGDRILKNGDKIYMAFGDNDLMSHMKPVFTTFKGWDSPISHVRQGKDLPKELADILKYVEENVPTPIDILSVGPEREENVFLV